MIGTVGSCCRGLVYPKSQIIQFTQQDSKFGAICLGHLQVDDLVTEADAKEAPAMSRQRAETLRRHAMVQMLTERSILMEIEADKSDRSLDWMV